MLSTNQVKLLEPEPQPVRAKTNAMVSTTAEKRIREQYQRPDEETAAREVLDAKCAELDVPGHEVEFDPDEAELCGAFREDALGEEDAIEAALDQEI